MAYYRIGTIGLSRTVIQDEQQLKDTLVHEYAHLLAYVRHGRKGVGHGPPWKQAMTDLGAPPKVRHNYEVQRNERRQEVAYQCQKCGALLMRSRKLPKRRRYVHINCGGPIKFAWARSVMPLAEDA
jgi:SprT protein